MGVYEEFQRQMSDAGIGGYGAPPQQSQEEAATNRLRASNRALTEKIGMPDSGYDIDAGGIGYGPRRTSFSDANTDTTAGPYSIGSGAYAGTNPGGQGITSTVPAYTQEMHDANMARLQQRQGAQQDGTPPRGSSGVPAAAQSQGYGIGSKAYRDQRNAAMGARNAASLMRGFSTQRGYVGMKPKDQASFVTATMDRYNQDLTDQARLQAGRETAEGRLGLGYAGLAQRQQQAGLEAQEGMLDRASEERVAQMGIDPQQTQQPQRQFYGQSVPAYTDPYTGQHNPGQQPYSGFTGEPAGGGGLAAGGGGQMPTGNTVQRAMIQAIIDNPDPVERAKALKYVGEQDKAGRYTPQ